MVGKRRRFRPPPPSQSWKLPKLSQTSLVNRKHHKGGEGTSISLQCACLKYRKCSKFFFYRSWKFEFESEGIWQLTTWYFTTPQHIIGKSKGKVKVKTNTSRRSKRPERIPVSLAWSSSSTAPGRNASPSQGYLPPSSMSPVPIYAPRWRKNKGE